KCIKPCGECIVSYYGLCKGCIKSCNSHIVQYFKKIKQNFSIKQKNWPKFLNAGISILIIYYQTLGFIFGIVSATTIVSQLALLDVIGAFETTSSSDKGSGICFYNGMTAKAEILLALLMP